MKPGSFRQLLHPKYFQAFNGNCDCVGVPDSMVASLDAELVQRPKVNQLQRVSLTRSSFPQLGEAGHIVKPLMTFARHTIAGAFNYEAQPF